LIIDCHNVSFIKIKNTHYITSQDLVYGILKNRRITCLCLQYRQMITIDIAFAYIKDLQAGLEKISFGGFLARNSVYKLDLCLAKIAV